MAAVAAVGSATADDVVPGTAPVTFQREKPEQTKRPSLVFLRENLDFLRAQIDGVHWAEDAKGSEASAIDPRWLDYLEMIGALGEGEAALGNEAEELALASLFESVGGLVSVEERLGVLSSLLDGHETRLAELHEDYVQDHVTSLVLLVRGYPEWRLDGLHLRREDGRETVFGIDAGLERVLKSGGVIEVDHEFIEPRPQWLELVVPASAGHDGFSVYFEVEPVRDRLHFVQIDLSSFHLDRSTAEWRAESWSRPAVLGSMDWTW